MFIFVTVMAEQGAGGPMHRELGSDVRDQQPTVWYAEVVLELLHPAPQAAEEKLCRPPLTLRGG